VNNINNSLNSKVKQVFSKAVVNKLLTRRQEIKRFPKFIQEWIISKFCETEFSPDKVQEMNEFIHKYLPEKREKQRVLSDIMTDGTYKLIDEYKVEVDIKKGKYQLKIPLLDIRDAEISNYLIEEHERLLIDGVWGLGVLNYIYKENKISMENFIPLQLSNFNLDSYIKGRSYFDKLEWLDLLVNTIGLNPENLKYEEKFLLLTRLIPLIEQNINFIELGPKQTGKSYIYRNCSYYSRIISGGQISPAVLFYNLNTKTPGLLASYDCLVFDEATKMKFKEPEEVLGKLTVFMESGYYDRGNKKVMSDTSIVLIGNIDINFDGTPKLKNYFDVLPEKIRKDEAFIDRFHGYIPGWKFRKIQDSETHLSRGYGFAIDYFSEVMHSLRQLNFQNLIEERIRFNNMYIRDETRIKQITSGFLKLLYPNQDFSTAELQECLDLAIQLRQIIIDQLHHINPNEFKKYQLEYELIY